MIYGIKYWNEPSIRYDQTQNAVEAIIKKIKLEIRKDFLDFCSKYNITNVEFINEFANSMYGYYESCGASAFCTIMEGMDYLKIAEYPKTANGSTIQFDDFSMVFLNDPRRNNSFEDSDEMDNRWARSYVTLAKLLFDCEAQYIGNGTFDFVKDQLKFGNGVQLLLHNPGHYIAAIAYDEDRDVIIYNDSWGKRSGLEHVGLHETLSRSDFDNVRNLSIVYEVKK